MVKLEMDKLILATIITAILIAFTASLTGTPFNFINFIMGVLGFSILTVLSILAINMFVVKKSGNLAIFIGTLIGTNLQFVVVLLLSGSSLFGVLNVPLQLGAIINGVILLGSLVVIRELLK